ncbi:MAG: uracil phosphoribosyltransferase [Desulfurococcales archaeon]|nr:uracil phosphoribosyltransferase [Desulfurococcales archaeon]
MEIHVLAEEVPYARLILRHLRDKNTGVSDFRGWMEKAGILLGVFISRSLSWRRIEVETPLGSAVELDLETQPLVVSILGAGVYLANGIMKLYPGAPLGLVSAKRIEDGSEVRIEVYYSRLPTEWRGESIIVDPMLATGSTVSRVIDELKKRGSSKIIVGAVISSIQGISYLSSKHPDVEIYTLGLDKELDSRNFIVPGLGDAGDRSLGVVF